MLCGRTPHFHYDDQQKEEPRVPLPRSVHVRAAWRSTRPALVRTEPTLGESQVVHHA